MRHRCPCHISHPLARRSSSRRGSAFPVLLLGALGLAAVTAPAQGPSITEFMARNADAHRDPRSAELPDWIELHNPTAAAVQLSGYYLTDNSTDLTKWRLPSLRILPGAYALVYASGENRTYSNQTPHTNFSLAADGEYLALVLPDGVTVASEFAARPQLPNLSYGRVGAIEGYFETPTPGAANAPVVFADTAQPVDASVPRGRFTAAFDLTLSTASSGAEIRYTTDGTEPSRTHGQLALGPIPITRSTVVRAVAYSAVLARSEIATFSYLFFDDVLAQSTTPVGWPAEWGVHDSPFGPYTRIGDYAMDPAVTQDPSLREMLLEGLEQLPVISLVMDPADLFDDEHGIFDNPHVEGAASERPVSVELMQPRMGRAQQVDAGIRVHGRGSRRGYVNAKFSLRLTFKGSYGVDEFDASLFGLGTATEHNTLILRAVFNDSYLGAVLPIYLRDMFVRDCETAVGHVHSHGVYCHLFVNGLYWGLYNPSERPDAAFQAQYHGGDREDYDVIKHFNGVVVDGDRQAYEQAKNIAAAGLSSHEAYAALRGYVDVENLAEYMLINMFCVSADWPQNNWYMARRREPGKLFEFYSWDAEFALRVPEFNLVNVNASDGPAFFYGRLRDNAEFRLLMADRAHALMFDGGPLSTERCIARFTARAAEIRSSIVAESARWGDYARSPGFSLAEWDQMVAYEVEQFFPARPAHFVAQLRAAGLYPAIEAPLLQGPHGGHVAPGTQVTLVRRSGSAGTIHYTTDGSDPRLVGGAVAPSAMAFTSALPIARTTTIKARLRVGAEWSALTEATFRLPGVVIHEVLAQNTRGITDPAGEREDWIELYNPTADEVHVGGFHLTDDPRKPDKWTFPEGVMLAPYGCLLVWADEDGEQADLHANFKLSADGEGVFLFDVDGRTMLSGFHFGPQRADVSIGWLDDAHDGGHVVSFLEPSPGVPNEIASGRRLFSGRDHALHTMQLDLSGTGQPGGGNRLELAGAVPNDMFLLLGGLEAGYEDRVFPGSQVALLLGARGLSSNILPVDASGRFVLPLDPLFAILGPSAIGTRVYWQAFAATEGGLLASNAVEIVF